jgi:hypothetical protein
MNMIKGLRVVGRVLLPLLFVMVHCSVQTSLTKTALTLP